MDRPSLVRNRIAVVCAKEWRAISTLSDKRRNLGRHLSQ